MKIAMIFAAGLGSRLGNLTRKRPKALVEVGGVSLLENAIRTLSGFGFKRIIINTHHFSEQITDFLKDKKNFGLDISVSDESNLLLDTGGGLKRVLQDGLNGDDSPGDIPGGSSLLIYNVDIISNMDLGAFYQAHQDSGALATLAVRHRETSRYLLADDTGRLVGWRNISTGEEIRVTASADSLEMLAFSGIHVVSPKLLPLMPGEDVFPIMPFYLDIAKDNLIQTYLHDTDSWLDVGKPHSLEEARKLIESKK